MSAPSSCRPRLTPFVGREAELPQLATWLEPPGCRLLTLIGPGGIGKTRLALQLAAELVDALRRWRLSSSTLAPIRRPELVASAIAQTLGVTEAAASRCSRALDRRRCATSTCCWCWITSSTCSTAAPLVDRPAGRRAAG